MISSSVILTLLTSDVNKGIIIPLIIKANPLFLGTSCNKGPIVEDLD